jgi:hypothetical protein
MPEGIGGGRTVGALDLDLPFPAREGDTSGVAELDFVGDGDRCGYGSSSELSTPQRVRNEV